MLLGPQVSGLIDLAGLGETPLIFVFLPFLLITRSTGEALSNWLLYTLLWEAGVAALAGLLLGYLAGRLLRWAEAGDLIESDWRLIYTVALALFVGWFGPIAVSAVYYAALMEHRLEEPVIWHVVSLIICFSVVAHGMTAVPFTRWFGRATGARQSDGS